ncbi:hypothetical protein WJX73_001531 [Symbiochloris irregularis]|uniref:tRNA-splicing endonuclease subunit Sen54 N-terminal domain-containing protein n=1 Tax=Symbiochloris irregularis TaxID=706552 RepID=A0AAW1NRN8_9CHLO
MLSHEARSRKLKEKLDALLELWTAPRKGHDAAAAVWRPERRGAELIRATGKLIPRMGFKMAGKQHLHVEEAVFLVDRGDLLFQAESQPGLQPLSVAEAITLMVSAGVSLDVYWLYCNLMAAGFTVLRHPSKWTLQPGEDIAHAWPSWSPTKSAPANVGQLAGPLQAETAAAAPHESAEAPFLSPADSTGQPCATGDQPMPQSQGRQQQWWGQPPGLCDGDSFLAQLPRCAVKADAGGSSILRPLPTIAPAATANEEPALTLLFDVFRPSSKFSRKDPGTPAAVVALAEGPHVPGLAAIKQAEAACGGASLVVAVMSGGSASFFQL